MSQTVMSPRRDSPPQVGELITGEQDLFWPSSADKGIAVGAIAMSAEVPELPGYIKEFSPSYGQVWRRISSAEIQHRRKTTLWR